MTSQNLQALQHPGCDRRIGSGVRLFRVSLLRSTLAGEYLSLLMLCCSVLITFSWSLWAVRSPATPFIVVSALWTAFRAIGGLAGEKWTVAVSAGLMMCMGGIWLSGITDVPGWLTASFVSPVVLLVMLSLILLVDCCEWYRSASANLTLQERRHFRARAIALSIAGLALIWSVGIPVTVSLSKWNRPPLEGLHLEEPTLIEHVGLRSAESLVTVCFLAFGANIGSFLNVVIWRMPLGRSIVYEKSSCPVCATAIQGRDNIPVFGWLKLGGQCRTCGTDISARYPIVEAVTAGMFLVLYFTELISGGVNLPFRPVNQYRGVLWIIMYAKWDLIGLYLFHCFLLCTLLVWSLMAVDRQRVPGRLLVFTFLVAVSALWINPQLALVPVAAPFSGIQHVVRNTGVNVGWYLLAGATAGFIGGMIIHRIQRRWSTATAEYSAWIVPAMTLAGIILGWQAVVSIAFLYGLLKRVRFRCQGLPGILRGTPAPCDLLLVTLVHHLFWSFQWQWCHSY
jgi:leader peptidase (prepilin peptidase) / N-methyltransferase